MKYAAWFVTAVSLFAQAPTAEQSISLRRQAGAVISPDGRFVAYGVRKANWEDNSFETEIWIADSATGKRYRLTGGKKSSEDPVWAPDSSRLAFASDREGKRQLYLIAPTGGEAVQLLSHETTINRFEWSPDGKWIYFTASDAEPKTMKDRKEKYGDYQLVSGDYTRTHLWRVPVPAMDDLAPGKAKAERLTEGDALSVQAFAVSPDGSRIAFSGQQVPDLSAEPSDLYVLSVGDKMLKKVVEQRGPDSNPVWSPDGTRIAFSTANGEEYYYYKNNRIATVSPEGGKPSLIPLKFDENANLLKWTPDGLYFTGFEKTYAHLFRANPETGAVERVTPDRSLLYDFTLTKDRQWISFAGSFDGSLPEVWVSRLKPFEPRKLTNFADQLKDFKIASREVIEWKSTDGTPIEGVLVKPRDFDPSKKYPLLVVIHGGPTGIDMPQFQPDAYYPIERFVAKGALVLRPNYRGSAGYGEKFRSLNVRNLGVGDAWDVLSGVDHLIAKGYVDKERVGAMGWSQGGYISAYLTTTTARFKAISVGAGISNWMTYYVNTDIHPFTRQYLKATPWDDPEIYRKTSPMSFIKGAKTPTLIQHGEFDRRVPIPNAYELLQGLVDVGVPAKMYVYKGFGHGITKPRELRAVADHNYEWFAEYIWNEKPAAK
ncbi:MAG: S9 family peptidase [Bryobacteraceae bacterium]|nr:S9 family peptidase [Bryobacteraceae bacterium]